MADLTLHDSATYVHGVPYDYYRELRDHDPVSHHDHPGYENGYWAVTRHADVQRVSRDSETFHNAPNPFLMDESAQQGDEAGSRELLISLDAPEHVKMRKLDQPRVHAPPGRRPHASASRTAPTRSWGRSRAATRAIWWRTSRSGCRSTSSPTWSGCPRTTGA